MPRRHQDFGSSSAQAGNRITFTYYDVQEVERVEANGTIAIK